MTKKDKLLFGTYLWDMPQLSLERFYNTILNQPVSTFLKVNSAEIVAIKTILNRIDDISDIEKSFSISEYKKMVSFYKEMNKTTKGRRRRRHGTNMDKGYGAFKNELVSMESSTNLAKSNIELIEYVQDINVRATVVSNKRIPNPLKYAVKVENSTTISVECDWLSKIKRGFLNIDIDSSHTLKSPSHCSMTNVENWQRNFINSTKNITESNGSLESLANAHTRDIIEHSHTPASEYRGKSHKRLFIKDEENKNRYHPYLKDSN